MHRAVRTGSTPKRHRREPTSRAGLPDAAAAVITLTEHIDADLLTFAGAQLRIIANVAGGDDDIDLAAAAAAGGTVTNTPGVLDQAGADHILALSWILPVDGGERAWAGDNSNTCWLSSTPLVFSAVEASPDAQGG